MKADRDIPNLFIINGKKIERLKLNIALPTSTLVCKVGATAAAKQLDGPSNTLIAKQLAHDPRVSAAYSFLCYTTPKYSLQMCFWGGSFEVEEEESSYEEEEEMESS